MVVKCRRFHFDFYFPFFFGLLFNRGHILDFFGFFLFTLIYFLCSIGTLPVSIRFFYPQFLFNFSSISVLFRFFFILSRSHFGFLSNFGLFFNFIKFLMFFYYITGNGKRKGKGKNGGKGKRKDCRQSRKLIYQVY